MRSFPSAPLAAAVAAGVIVLSAVVPGSSADDDLKDRQDRVEDKIEQATESLEHASAAMQAATQRVGAAEAKLTSSQAQLAAAKQNLFAVQAKLRKARAVDASAEARLDAAKLTLDVARDELKQGRQDVADQRVEVANAVSSAYEKGDPTLLAMSSLTRAESLEDVTRSLAAREAIVDKGNLVYDAFVAAEAALEARKEEVADAKDAVADERRAAKENLLRIERLRGQAADAKNSVRALVNSRRSTKQEAVSARADAARIRAADLKALEELEKREQRIRQLILAAASQNDSTFNGDTGGLLNQPVNGYVTSPYGYRTHPIYGYYALHNGIDFGAPCGANLYAAADGVVVEQYYDSAYGNRVFLNIGRVNGKNMTLVYNHLSAFKLSTGARVKRGDVVGYVGTTGWSTGCHLHFTVLLDGDAVDPAPYL